MYHAYNYRFTWSLWLCLFIMCSRVVFQLYNLLWSSMTISWFHHLALRPTTFDLSTYNSRPLDLQLSTSLPTTLDLSTYNSRPLYPQLSSFCPLTPCYLTLSPLAPHYLIIFLRNFHPHAISVMCYILYWCSHMRMWVHPCKTQLAPVHISVQIWSTRNHNQWPQ